MHREQGSDPGRDGEQSSRRQSGTTTQTPHTACAQERGAVLPGRAVCGDESLPSESPSRRACGAACGCDDGGFRAAGTRDAAQQGDSACEQKGKGDTQGAGKDSAGQRARLFPRQAKAVHPAAGCACAVSRGTRRTDGGGEGCEGKVRQVQADQPVSRICAGYTRVSSQGERASAADH